MFWNNSGNSDEGNTCVLIAFEACPKSENFMPGSAIMVKGP